MTQDSSKMFDQERAAAYDKRFSLLAPKRDALHLMMRIVLLGLSRIALTPSWASAALFGKIERSNLWLGHSSEER